MTKISMDNLTKTTTDAAAKWEKKEYQLAMKASPFVSRKWDVKTHLELEIPLGLEQNASPKTPQNFDTRHDRRIGGECQSSSFGYWIWFCDSEKQ